MPEPTHCAAVLKRAEEGPCEQGYGLPPRMEGAGLITCRRCGAEMAEAKVPGQKGVYQLECPEDRRHDVGGLPYTRKQQKRRESLAARAARDLEAAAPLREDDEEPWWA